MLHVNITYILLHIATIFGIFCHHFTVAVVISLLTDSLFFLQTFVNEVRVKQHPVDLKLRDNIRFGYDIL